MIIIVLMIFIVSVFVRTVSRRRSNTNARTRN